MNQSGGVSPAMIDLVGFEHHMALLTQCAAGTAGASAAETAERAPLDWIQRYM